MNYGIGLDIGVASVGWAIVALDSKDEPYGIVELGSRIFDAAEHPKTGASLAAPRREKRSMRRRLRRHRHRNERIKELIINSGLIEKDELQHLFEGRLSDIYQLRVDALDRLVSDKELARILIHISQRRGFRSNRKAATTNEDGELLNAVNENKQIMQEKGYRTIAEMFLKDDRYSFSKRNKGGQYIATVGRDLVEEEVHKIFESQRSFGNCKATESLESDYLEVLLSQRSFDEGPGNNSPYSGNMIERMIGNCVFEPSELRAAKASYSFELFSLLEHINHIRIKTNGTDAELTDEQRKRIVELAHKSPDLNYAKIRKELGLTPDQTFNMVRYDDMDNIQDAEKKTKLSYLKAYHQMRKAFDSIEKGYIEKLSVEKRDAIADALSKYKTSSKIRPLLIAAGLSEAEIDIAESLSFSKFGHISVNACQNIIPHLEKGMKYNEACSAAGYEFRAHNNEQKTMYLPPLGPDDKNTVTSPVVQRSVSQTIKVVNAIIRKMNCSPTFINIELAREMSKDFYERKTIEKEQKENRANNERLMERIRNEYGKPNPSGMDLLKLKLFEEQGGVCAYSLKQMSLEHLFDDDYAEIDHIIPYSISFDDSMKNKVLVYASENRDKGNRLPLQYLTGKRRDDYIVWVNNCVHNYRKRQMLLKESISDSDRDKFIERNLQDTKTASVFLMNYIRDHLEFEEFFNGKKKHVAAVNGSITAYVRKRWGISKIRANGDIHHAVDALIIACTTDGLIQRVSKYSKYKESRYAFDESGTILVHQDTGEVVAEFPYPWPRFRKELEARLSNDPENEVGKQGFSVYQAENLQVKPIFVSRMPKHKVTGAAHQETIRGLSKFNIGNYVSKKKLTDLKLKDGEIENYYNPGSDKLLYEALKKQLVKFNGDAKKAFAEPFYKPRRDGTQGPLVRTVKIEEPTSLNVSLDTTGGVAANGDMVRIDVFHVDNDGYYFVPVYVADTVKTELPHKACVAFKPYNEWKEMNDKDFIFSLYPNDLVKVTHKRAIKLSLAQKESELPSSYEAKSEFLYYKSAGISGATVTCINHDGSYKIDSLGIKTLAALEKYNVDVLGVCHKVKSEKRQQFI